MQVVSIFKVLGSPRSLALWSNERPAQRMNLLVPSPKGGGRAAIPVRACAQSVSIERQTPENVRTFTDTVYSNNFAIITSHAARWGRPERPFRLSLPCRALNCNSLLRPNAPLEEEAEGRFAGDCRSTQRSSTASRPSKSAAPSIHPM